MCWLKYLQKYQDNLEFMQWFKRFYEMSVQDKGDYDCAAVRTRGKGILLRSIRLHHSVNLLTISVIFLVFIVRW